MRTLEEYVAMIPAAPPADIDRYLDALGRKPLAITSYRCISRDDAESRLDCEDFRADLRPSAAIRPAALWCSECESWYLAEYVPAYGVPCSPNLTYQNNSGVQVVNVEQDTIDKKRNGETMVCPLCGAQTQLRNVQELRYGRAAQDFIAVPTVAENCLVLTQWCIERYMYEGYRHTERNAINAFVVDGRRIIKLAHYQYNAMNGSWRNLGTWVQRAKLVDDIGCPKMYAANLPDLGGTGAENAKLWEYMEQSNAAKTFYPVAYLRLHYEIMAAAQAAAASLLDLARKIKLMRDTGGYKALGFDTLEAYTLTTMGMKQRQAYNYIAIAEKLPAQLIEQNAAAGVTKLALLAQLSGQEQQQITAETNLTETTVAELKAQIKELQAKNAGYAEQLSLLQNQPPVAEVQAEEVDMDALRAEIRAEMKAEMESQRRADAKMTELNQKERDEAIKAARKAKEELEEIQRAAAAAKQAHAEELAKTRRQAEETAARLNMAADESTVRFGLLFDQLQDAAGKVLDLADAVQQTGETEKAGKFRAALYKALLALADEANGVQK